MSSLTGIRAAVVNWRDLQHSLAGGSERFAWEYARALADAGAEVEFVTAREPGQARRETIDGIPVRRGGSAFGFYAHAALYYLRNRRRLDLVIDPECGIPTFSPLFVRRSTAVVLIVHHVHLAQFARYFPAPLARLGQWLERSVMPRVYRRVRTVAVSESTVVEMRQQLGWRGPVDLLANGTQAPSEDECGLLFHRPDRLLVLGRLVPHKRVDLVVDALASLLAERPGLTLDICGQGPEQERLAQLIAERGLERHVTVHGFLPEEDKRTLLREARLHVCASEVEGWGQVVIEAAGYGLPTVARDVPGLRDSVRDGETGWLIPEADPDTLPERLTDAIRVALADLDDTARRAEMFSACRAWAGRFSWSRMHAEAQQLAVEELRRRGRLDHSGAATATLPLTDVAAPAADAAPHRTRETSRA